MDKYIIKLPFEIKRKIALYLQVPYLKKDTICNGGGLIFDKHSIPFFLSCYRYYTRVDWCHLCGEYLNTKPSKEYFSHFICKVCNIVICSDCQKDNYKTYCKDHKHSCIEWFYSSS